MTRAELLPQIFSLSPNDQIMLMDAIRDHLTGALAAVDEKEFRQELQRRLDDMRENPADESSLDEVMARLKKR